VRAWALGQRWITESGIHRYVKPVIKIADPREHRLSFQNLVELHVLSAITHRHKVRLPKVRAALEFLKREFQSEHPLAEFEFQTDGYRLFVEHWGKLLNLNQGGQLVLGDVLKEYLARVEWEGGQLRRLYPFLTRTAVPAKTVVIDPRVQFGRPCLVGRRVTTDVLFDRWLAGEPLESLMNDFGVTPDDLDGAFRYESNVRSLDRIAA
jgi:uncharacterized protein (DUF433 family)